MAEIPEHLLAPLRARFLARLAADGERLATLAGDPSGAPEIADIVHRMAGIAGSLGYPEISALALAVERRSLGAPDSPFGEGAEWADLLAGIARTCAAAG